MTLVTPLWLMIFLTVGLSATGLSLRFLGFAKSLIVVPVVWGISVWSLTEGLSFTHSLTPQAISVFWLISVVALIIAAARFQVFQYIIGEIRACWQVFHSLTFSFRLLGYVIAAIWLTALILAIASPPNNWDSMTYHLPRVMNWIQNGSVEYYTTYNARQVVQPPLSSYATLQSIITTRQDYLVNLVQWVAGAWSLVVIGAIAKQLKASNEIAMLAAFFAATIPIGIAESTTTQNDWLMSLWVLLMAYLWLSYSAERFSFRFVVLASGGLLFCAGATKQLSVIFAGVFFAALLVSIFVRRGFWHGVVAAATGTIGAALAIAPQFVRNYLSFGSFLGDPQILEILAANRVGVARSAIAEPVVHAFFNIPVPGFLPVEQIGDFLGDPFGQGNRSLFSLWGLDRYLPFPGMQLHEDSAASPITFFLGLTALAWFLWKYHDTIRRTYAIGTLLLYFGIFFTVSAREGSNRYLLTAMLLASIPLAIWLHALGPKILLPVTVITASYACFFVLFMEYRPILPSFEVFTTSREDLYFKARPELIAPYRQFADTVSDGADGPPQVIGIVQGYNDWEYPLWVLAGAPWQSKIVHLGVLPSGERIGFEDQLATVDILFDSFSTGQPTTTRLD
jgi:hypothetical protein